MRRTVVRTWDNDGGGSEAVHVGEVTSHEGIFTSVWSGIATGSEVTRPGANSGVRDVTRQACSGEGSRQQSELVDCPGRLVEFAVPGTALSLAGSSSQQGEAEKAGRAKTFTLDEVNQIRAFLESEGQQGKGGARVVKRGLHGV